MSDVENEFAFVVSRIGSDLSPERKWANAVFKFVIEPAFAEWEIIPRRADHVTTPDVISVRIVEDIIAARVVIVDLTASNPNVYYELAIAHAFGRPVILLVDSPENLAFDISHHRSIPLGPSDVPLAAESADAAKKALVEALKEVLAEGYRPKSVVTEAETARLVQDSASDDPQAQELANLRRTVEQLRSDLQTVARRTKPSLTEVIAAKAAPDPSMDFFFLRNEFAPVEGRIRVYPTSNPFSSNALVELADGRKARFAVEPNHSPDKVIEEAVQALLEGGAP